jgi:hypothetical protein
LCIGGTPLSYLSMPGAAAQDAPPAHLSLFFHNCLRRRIAVSSLLALQLVSPALADQAP